MLTPRCRSGLASWTDRIHGAPEPPSTHQPQDNTSPLESSRQSTWPTSHIQGGTLWGSSLPPPNPQPHTEPTTPGTRAIRTDLGLRTSPHVSDMSHVCRRLVNSHAGVLGESCATPGLELGRPAWSPRAQGDYDPKDAAVNPAPEALPASPAPGAPGMDIGHLPP